VGYFVAKYLVGKVCSGGDASQKLFEVRFVACIMKQLPLSPIYGSFGHHRAVILRQ